MARKRNVKRKRTTRNRRKVRKVRKRIVKRKKRKPKMKRKRRKKRGGQARIRKSTVVNNKNIIRPATLTTEQKIEKENQDKIIKYKKVENPQISEWVHENLWFQNMIITDRDNKKITPEIKEFWNLVLSKIFVELDKVKPDVLNQKITLMTGQVITPIIEKLNTIYSVEMKNIYDNYPGFSQKLLETK